MAFPTAVGGDFYYLQQHAMAMVERFLRARVVLSVSGYHPFWPL